MLRKFSPFVLVATLTACSSSSSASSFVGTTLLEVSPDEFEGVGCGAFGEGDLQIYTAQLIDVTGFDGESDAGAANEVVSTSPPTSCVAAVSFSGVDTDRDYSALIEGYDQVGLSAVSEGEPTLELDGEVVAPTWSGHCGVFGEEAEAEFPGEDGEFFRDYIGPVEPVDNRTVTLRRCVLTAVDDDDTDADDTDADDTDADDTDADDTGE